ncbi:PEP-CTERM sorting domain-containing protein [Oxalobacteraceae bacterium A2-2]
MLKKLSGIILAVAGAQANAVTAPPLSLSTVTATPTNVTVGPTSKTPEIYDYQTTWRVDNQPVTTLYTQLITAPTTSAPGLEYNYKDVTTSYNDYKETWKVQTLTASVMADSSQYTGGKGIVLEAAITSASATVFTLSLSATGNFETTSGFFGVVIPALPTFYMATGTDPLAVATYGNTSTSGDFYSSGTSAYSFSVAAGETIHFKGAVYAGNDVSLSAFSLNFRSSRYDVVDTVQYHSDTVTTLLSARAIPALAVPEPGTYAMLAAGLGVLALRRSRRDDAFKRS